MKIMRILALFVVFLLISSCNALDRKAKITYNEDDLSLADITEMREIFINETLN